MSYLYEYFHEIKATGLKIYKLTVSLFLLTGKLSIFLKNSHKYNICAEAG